MVSCERCGQTVLGTRGCSYCNKTYCTEHRLPEKHDCSGVRGLDQFGGRFDSGFGT